MLCFNIENEVFLQLFTSDYHREAATAAAGENQKSKAEQVQS